MSQSIPPAGAGKDPVRRSGANPGDRVSLRHRLDDGGATDVIGFVLELGTDRILIERPADRVSVERNSVLALRVVPAIPRGRSPHGFAAAELDDLVRRTAGQTVASDPERWLTERCRLSEMLDEVCAESPAHTGKHDQLPYADHPGGRAWAAGEWAVLQLGEPAPDTVPVLGSWLVRRGCRNVVLLRPRGVTGGPPHLTGT